MCVLLANTVNHLFAVGEGLDEMAETLTLPDLLDKLESAVRAELESGVQ